MTENSSFTLEFEQFSQRRGQTHFCVHRVQRASVHPEAWDPLQLRLPKGGIPSPSSGTALSEESWLARGKAGEERQNLPCTDHPVLGLTQLLEEVESRGTSTSKALQPPLLSFQKCHCGTLCFL